MGAGHQQLHAIEANRDTIKSLEYDLNQQARSCGLTMPKRGLSR
jgi:hypothetical protein